MKASCTLSAFTLGAHQRAGKHGVRIGRRNMRSVAAAAGIAQVVCGRRMRAAGPWRRHCQRQRPPQQQGAGAGGPVCRGGSCRTWDSCISPPAACNEADAAEVKCVCHIAGRTIKQARACDGQAHVMQEG